MYRPVSEVGANATGVGRVVGSHLDFYSSITFLSY